jgi:TPR repeat protein
MQKPLLGLMYFKGEGVPINIPKALEYFLRAAEKDDDRAQNYLVYLYFEVMKDIHSAIHYLRLLADKNDIYAQRTLGKIYAGMTGFEKDLSEARHFLALAAAQGCEESQKRLEAL